MFSHLFHLFFIASSILCARVSPLVLSRSREITYARAHNNKEMAFVYTEMHVFLALFVQERSYEDSVRQRHSAGEYKAKILVYTVYEIGLSTEEDDGEIFFLRMSLYFACILPTTRVVLCIETLVGHVMHLNGLKLQCSGVVSSFIMLGMIT